MTYHNGHTDGLEHLLERSNPLSSQSYGPDSLESTLPRRRVIIGMSQTISQVFNRAKFAFRSGPAALKKPRFDQDLSFVRELRRRDEIELQAVGFQSLPILLDAITPVS